MVRPTWIRNLFTRRPATIRNRPATSNPLRARLGVETFEDRVVPAQFSGAIFTTDVAGAVNINIYDNKADVYLNGGPDKGGKVIPTGNYYFQVTDPSGKALLSSDTAADRVVTINSDGYIVSTSSHNFVDATDTSYIGDIRVQLVPYLDTPNNGGEYKLWLIAATGATVGEDGKSLVFGNDDSKTDNFKVKVDVVPPTETVALSGVKYYDQNTNGVYEPDAPNNELPIAGWVVYLDTNTNPNDGFLANTLTSSTNGSYKFAVDENFKVVGTSVTLSTGVTYYIYEGGAAESGYEGTWVQTGGIGGYTFVLNQGTNGPELQDGSPALAGVAVAPDQLDFGNVKLGAGGGHTLGFWSNKNGFDKMNDGGSATPELGPTGLGSLNLTHTNGFDGAGYTAPSSGALKGTTAAFIEFRTWILNANATNMSYMLSAQLAAMWLNREAGFVSGGALVYAPGANGANDAGFISITNLINEANAALLLDPVANRDYMESLKNALDNANNNLNFVLLGSDLDANHNGIIEPNEA